MSAAAWGAVSMGVYGVSAVFGEAVLTNKAAIFHKEDVHFTSGEEQLIYWDSSNKSQEYSLPCKVSCKTCRTPIMDEGRNMLLLFPTLIHFKDAKHKRMFHPR